VPLKRSLRYLSPAYLATAASLARACLPARRLLRGLDLPLPPVAGPPSPYDHQLVRRLRQMARGIGRLVAGRRDGPAAGTVAAFLLLRRTGWPVSVEIGKGTARPAARLGLWNVPILGDWPGRAQPDRILRSGPEVRLVEPRSPAPLSETVSRAPCKGALRDPLRIVLEPLGGPSAAVAPGQSVLLKPNFNSYHPSPASTSFDLLSCVVELLREAGAGRIAVGECSAIALSPTRPVVQRAGLLRWAEEHGVEAILFDEQPWCSCAIGGQHYQAIIVPECLQRFDRLIYLVSAKTHRQAGVSLSLKLGVGWMHPVQRIVLHADHLPERIAEISLAVRPDLVIADARRCFISGGPEVGEVREPGLILASLSPEALDETLIQLLEAEGAAGLEPGRRQVEAARALGFSNDLGAEEGDSPAPRE
jgi:uncharacterized protein (DUF362 family)